MEQQPIIRRVKKRRSHDAHGGSWKVAYADFVTAMMAFFLLLWLITMVSPEKRLALSEYFRNFNLFKEQTVAAGRGITAQQQGLVGDRPPKVAMAGATELRQKARQEKQLLAERLKGVVDEKLGAYKDQIYIDIVEGGVRIQVVDTEGSVMFPLGSAEPTPRARQIIAVIADQLKDLPHRVAVEGHTDSAPFRSSQITNWELSSARASAARRELEKNGFDPAKIARVVGFADQEPFVKDNPRDPRNRRISIIVLSHQGELTKPSS
ncbi:MAG TPA: flagellar motor protein MotB [Syntrophales bacterium]|nr:flagellar motor protein MotB [Syntrophales bacterium]